eukprot:jgi/Mesvir1/8975/Mv14196-RA.1
MGKAKFFMIFVNTITLIAGILLVAIGIWMFAGGTGLGSGCREWLQYPILISGICIFVVSLIGYVTAIRQTRFLIAIYIILMIVFILIALAFAVFMFIITNPDGAQKIEGTGFKQYRIGDYSTWLQDQVNEDWADISKCLKSTVDCPTTPPSSGGLTNDLKRACCFSPPGCFGSPSPGPALNCTQYSAVDDVRCWNCDQCRGSFMSIIRDEWDTVAIVTIVAVGLMVLTIMAACFLRMGRSNEVSYSKA